MSQTDIKVRLKQAWNEFKQKANEEQIKQVEASLLHHSESLLKHTLQEARSSEFSLVKSVLEERLEEDVAQLISTHYSGVTKLQEVEKPLEFELKTMADGEIVGSSKYEVLDIDWLEAACVWLENYFKTKRPFPQPAAWFNIPDSVSLALFGDWGGGTWKDNNVATTITKEINHLQTDINIHLGDVYYAGEPESEQQYLLDLWPAGKLANFTLNSNHEMYPLGKGYFDTTLANNLFKNQKGKSFFALENTDWIIVGLDSAFDADTNHLYLKGKINQVQKDFLAQVATKNKNVIVLSHHNPLDISGQNKNTFWDEVATPLGDTLKYWYWGHIHGAAVYKTVDNNVNCRLIGHGVIPWGNATSLHNSDAVVWYENKKPSPIDGARVQNGFVHIELEGKTLSEKFYGEDGEVHWPPKK